MNYCRQHVHLIASEQNDGFRNFDRKLQNFIIGINSAQNTFDTLKDLIKVEDASSKQHISQEFQKVRRKWGSTCLILNIFESSNIFRCCMSN